MVDYHAELCTLTDELADAKERLAVADDEGVRTIKHQIKEIERDIQRYSARAAVETVIERRPPNETVAKPVAD